MASAASPIHIECKTFAVNWAFFGSVCVDLPESKAWIGFGFTLVVAALNICGTEGLGLGQLLSPFIELNLGKAAGDFYHTLASDFCKERHQFRLVWCEVGA